MKKPVLIVIGIIVILLLIGAGVWYFSKMPADTAEVEISDEAVQVRDAVREQSSTDLSLEANANAETGTSSSSETEGSAGE
jgi:uncharacterized protein YxeA